MLLDYFLGTPKLATSQGNRRLSEIPGQLFGNGRKSASGATVTDDTALSLSSVFSGVLLLGEIMGILPVSVYRRSGDDKDEAYTHPAYRVLHVEPNPWMTPKQYKQVMEWNRRFGGNAYAEIQWTAGSNVAAVWPLAYWRVEIKWNTEKTDFHYLVDGRTGNGRIVQKQDMIHVPLVTWDGVCGHSFLDFAVESIGLGITKQQAASYCFANDARPGGYLSHTGNPTEPQRKEMRRSIEEVHAGAQGRNKFGIFWGGWEWHENNAVTPEQMQALESQRFTVEEAARWLRIPPHLLYELTRSTFNNIEHQGIEFVVFTGTPMTVSYEQEYDRKLLNPPTLYCKHNLSALMRGDSNARANYYRQMWGIGAFSINDVCELEDMNPVGKLGDLRFIPANYQTLENASQAKPQPPPGQPNSNQTPPDAQPGSDAPGGTNDPNGGLAMQLWAQEVFERMLRKEAKAANRATGQPNQFLSWMDKFYSAHVETVTAALTPVAMLLPLSTLANPNRAREAAEKHVQTSREQLLDLTDRVSAATLAPAVFSLTNDWEMNRPAQQAREFCEGENET